MRYRFLILPIAVFAMTTSANASVEEQAVVNVRAREIGADTPWPVSELTLMRVIKGEWQAMPFQIDETDVHGQVWVKGSGFDIAGEAGLFDADDQLLFVAGDMGEKASGGPVEGRVLREISVTSNGQQHWAYLVAGNNLKNQTRYVNHDPDTGITRTAHYLLKVDTGNELNWTHLGYQSYEEGIESSIVDTLRMTMAGGVLVSFARITLDNDNLKPRLRGFKAGPIRSVMHLETHVVFGGLPMMTMHVQVMRYANHYEAHTWARIPDIYRLSVKKPVVSVAIDGRGQLGAEVRTASSGNLLGKVDGKTDSDEAAMAGRGLQGEDSWILFDTRRDFIMMTRLDLPKALQTVPLSLVYRDEVAAKEQGNHPGLLPEVGYSLHGWPPEDDLRFSLQLFFDKDLHKLSPASYIRQRSGQDLAVMIAPANLARAGTGNP